MGGLAYGFRRDLSLCLKSRCFYIHRKAEVLELDSDARKVFDANGRVFFLKKNGTKAGELDMRLFPGMKE
jgi:hypothetical protein